MYAEDVDLCAAVRAHGRSVLFSAEPQIVHLRGRSAGTAPERVRNAYRKSQIAFYAKHHPGWVPFLKIYLKIRGRLPDTHH
jgi:GT2 family glycosyltransferase